MAGSNEVVLAFDYGARRIGVAVGQTTTGSASPLGAVAVHGTPDWAALERCLRDWSPSRLLVGLPYNMDGTDTLLTGTCRAFAAELARRFGIAGRVRRRATHLRSRDVGPARGAALGRANPPRPARGHRRPRRAADARDLAARVRPIDPGAVLDDRHWQRAAARHGRTPAPPPHPRRALARRARPPARPRAVLRALARRPAGARPEPRRAAPSRTCSSSRARAPACRSSSRRRASAPTW